MAKSIKDLAREKTQLSPLAVGTKLTTDELVGKDIYLTNADIVSYEELKNGETRVVTFCVCTVADSKKKTIGYYQGGKALTDIMSDIVCDDELLKQLQTEGLHVKLSATKTKANLNFTAIEVLD